MKHKKQSTTNEELRQQLQALVDNSVHAAPPLQDEPLVEMWRWRLFSVLWPDGRRTRHLVGHIGYEGRVCSNLVQLDARTLNAVTESGRRYELRGEPGVDSDADWVFSRWQIMWGVTDPRDITSELMRLHSQAHELGTGARTVN